MKMLAGLWLSGVVLFAQAGMITPQEQEELSSTLGSVRDRIVTAETEEGDIGREVSKAEADGSLAEKLGLRLDIPVKLLRELLARAER